MVNFYAVMLTNGCTFFLFISNLIYTHALYDDQIGKFDWRRQNIGNVQLAKFRTAKNLVAATDENVIVYINAENGDLHVLVMSGINHTKTLQCFGASKGNLVWEWPFDNNECLSVPQLLVSYNKGSIVVICDRLYSIDRTGDQVWSLNLSKYNAKTWRGFFLSTSTQILAIGKKRNDILDIIRISAKLGTVIYSTTLSLNTKIDECLTIGEKLLCFDYASGAIISVENEGNVFSTKLIANVEGGILKLTPVGEQAIAVFNRLNVGKYLCLDEAEHLAQLVKSDIENVVDIGMAVHGKDSYVVFGTSDKSQNSLIWLDEMGKEGPIIRIENSPEIYGVQKVFPVVITKSGSNHRIHRSVIISKDHAISAFDESEKPLWVRQEALSKIVSVEMLDLPLSESQASVESEFSTSGQNLVSMFVRRLSTQAKQIQRGFLRMFNESIMFISALSRAQSTSDLISIAKSVSSKNSRDSAPFEQDYFNLHKIIVAVTSIGKVYGLDNRRGNILWQLYIPDINPFSVLGQPSFPLFVQRKTAHYPFPAQCALVGKEKVNYFQSSGFTRVTFFDPVPGTVKGPFSIEYNVKQVALLPVSDAEELFGLAILTQDDKVVIHPRLVETPLRKFLLEKPFFLFNYESSNGELLGYRLEKPVEMSVGSEETLVWNTEKVWTIIFIPGRDGKIIDIKMKRSNERVHSQGRVLGDRSVLYKYSNPNLVALTLKKIDETKKSTFTIYLLDAITGNVQFVLTHHRVAQPFHLVHCENWLVYSFYNEKARRTEFTVLELYEGKHQTDPDKFSSYAVRPQLMVTRQSYIFPQGVLALAVTDTEKGITSKHLLVALPFGGLLELHKAFLDPRRVMVPTQEEREEGIIPYMPDLPIATEHIINYNQSVFNIRAIHTAPAGLESTSLVLAYGLDMFYTRVHPPATFDILKDDFDHWFISLMLLGLVLASISTKRLAKFRDLKSAWK